MNTVFNDIVQRLRSAIGNLTHSVADRLAPQPPKAPPPPPPPPPGTDPLLGQGDSQPFNPSPEEALVFAQRPPVGKVKRRIIVPISQSGETPELVEEIKLTALGRIVARTEFQTMDGQGSVGKSENIKGFCPTCTRFSFQGSSCEVCGQFCCPACAVLFEEGSIIHRLCPTCGKRAQWSKNTWK